MRECHFRVDKLQMLLYDDPAVSRLLKRRACTDDMNEELLSKLDKEHENLKRAGKKLKMKEAKVDEDCTMATHAAKAIQSQAAWKDYWAAARLEELTQWLQVERRIQLSWPGRYLCMRLASAGTSDRLVCSRE